MASTDLRFPSREAHRDWLRTQAVLPAGFRVGTTRFEFMPVEAPKPAAMNLTLIALDESTPDFAAVFTRNAFPGAPVIIGRRRLDEPSLGAVVVNNKVSNVRAPDGVATAERVCGRVAESLGLLPNQVIPSSTGVIGWRIPVDAMLSAVPAAAASVGKASLFDAAQAIMTTDLYPKVRRARIGQGSIVGIAKGAGMIEPNMATMLVYLLTDLAVPRATLRRLLPLAVEPTFNCISIDSDTSTSDTVLLLSSGRVPCADENAFAQALATVCADLAQDVVRNGEGVRHVIRTVVRGAPTAMLARGLGKAIVNAPLVKCAMCGNDPNVGRILMAIGKYVGAQQPDLPLDKLTLALGGHTLYREGAFALDGQLEALLVEHLKQAELYPSVVPADGVFKPAVDYPPHERCVELDLDLGQGSASATVYGADLTHEYVSENADYRS
jgi:glutamate N-acetyltransferase/amino-acid N-acetyltransferase